MELLLGKLNEYKIVYETIQETSSFDKIRDLFCYEILFEPRNEVEYRYMGLYYECVKKDFKNAKKYYLMGINENDIYCMTNLADYYEKIKKNYEKTVKYYTMAIDHGDLRAMNFLGLLYFKKENYIDAEKYFLLALENGNNSALYNLIKYYEDVKQEYISVNKYCLVAIRNRNFKIFYELGQNYDNEKNYTNAVKYFVLIIENDNDHQCVTFAFYYVIRHYDFFKQDHVIVNIYYSMAIERGYIDAIYKLGYFYETKDGVKAEKYYLEAVKYGNSKAMYRLAHFYYKIKNLSRAEKYYLLAIENNNEKAKKNIAFYFEKIKKDYRCAIEYYLKQFDDTCDAKIMYRLGVCNHKIYNFSEATKYFTMANNQDDVKSFYRLRYYYIKGEEKHNLLKLYIKNQKYVDRKTIIQLVKDVWENINCISQGEQFVEILKSFKLHSNDDVSVLLRMFANLFQYNLDFMKLHYDYTLDGKGYQEAEKDFIDLIVKQK